MLKNFLSNFLPIVISALHHYPIREYQTRELLYALSDLLHYKLTALLESIDYFQVNYMLS